MNKINKNKAQNWGKCIWWISKVQQQEFEDWTEFQSLTTPSAYSVAELWVRLRKDAYLGVAESTGQWADSSYILTTVCDASRLRPHTTPGWSRVKMFGECSWSHCFPEGASYSETRALVLPSLPESGTNASTPWTEKVSRLHTDLMWKAEAHWFRGFQHNQQPLI